MLNEDQANAAARAILDQPQRDQQLRGAKLAAAKEKRSPPIRWLAVGALVGLSAGAALGYFFTGATIPWSILGLSLGMGIGMGFDRRNSV